MPLLASRYACFPKNKNGGGREAAPAVFNFKECGGYGVVFAGLASLNFSDI